MTNEATLAPTRIARPSGRDLVAGSIGAVVSLAGWVTVSLLAYAALGPTGIELGIPSACITVSVGGLVLAAAGRAQLSTGGLSGATVLIFAATVGELAADPAFRPNQPESVRALVAVASCVVLVTALAQALFGLLRLGSVARYVPKPVLAGFMNGVALKIVLSQVPTLLGVPRAAWISDAVGALGQAQPATFAIGAITVIVVFATMARSQRAPAALVGLLAGCALYAAVKALMPDVPLGALTGHVPALLPSPTTLLPLFVDAGATALLSRHATDIVVSGATIAIVGSIEILLNALQTDQERGSRHDPNRELLAFAAGNLACGLLGGLPLVNWRARSVALARLGSTTRWGSAVCAAATALLYLAGGRLIALLPLTVLSALMLVVAWGTVDIWTRSLVARTKTGIRSGDLWLNLALVGVVFGVTVWRGLVWGVAAGILLATALFIAAMNRSLVRVRYVGSDQPSRRLYPSVQEALLRDARRQILVLELEGALFFGNADRLASQVELEKQSRFVVIDLRRITTIDASGATLVAQLAARFAREGRRLLLAGVDAGNRHGRALAALAASSGAVEGWFPDADQAIEAAERELLDEHDLAIGDAELRLDQCALLQGLDDAQRMRLAPLLRSRQLAPKELLFRQGDPGDCVYVLTKGSITVSSAGDGNRLRQRYVSFSPGMMLGETAMLDGQGRTADAIADAASVVHALTRADLDRLRSGDPALAGQLMTNIALHLSERLRHAAAAWRMSAA